MAAALPSEDEHLIPASGPLLVTQAGKHGFAHATTPEWLENIDGIDEEAGLREASQYVAIKEAGNLLPLQCDDTHQTFVGKMLGSALAAQGDLIDRENGSDEKRFVT
jgi:hypothetical protein